MISRVNSLKSGPTLPAIGVFILGCVFGLQVLSVQHNYPYSDMMTYWNDAITFLQKGLFGHSPARSMPGIPFYWAAVETVTGRSNVPQAITLLNVFCYSVIATSASLVAWKLTGSRFACLIAGFLCLINQPYVAFLYVQMSEIPATGVFATAVLLVGLLLQDTKKSIWFVLLAASLFFYAGYMRPVLWCIGPATIPFLLYYSIRRRWQVSLRLIVLYSLFLVLLALSVARTYKATGRVYVFLPKETSALFIPKTPWDVNYLATAANRGRWLEAMQERFGSANLEETWSGLSAYARDTRQLDSYFGRFYSFFTNARPTFTLPFRSIYSSIDLPILNQGIFLPLALVSLALFIGNPLTIFLMLVLLIHHASYAHIEYLPRYRISADWIIISLAGAGMGHAIHKILHVVSERFSRRTALVGLPVAAVVLLALFCYPAFMPENDNLVTRQYLNLLRPGPNVFVQDNAVVLSPSADAKSRAISYAPWLPLQFSKDNAAVLAFDIEVEEPITYDFAQEPEIVLLCGNYMREAIFLNASYPVHFKIPARPDKRTAHFEGVIDLPYNTFYLQLGFSAPTIGKPVRIKNIELRTRRRSILWTFLNIPD